MHSALGHELRLVPYTVTRSSEFAHKYGVRSKKYSPGTALFPCRSEHQQTRHVPGLLDAATARSMTFRFFSIDPALADRIRLDSEAPIADIRFR